jgi:hypothetical protein
MDLVLVNKGRGHGQGWTRSAVSLAYWATADNRFSSGHGVRYHRCCELAYPGHLAYHSSEHKDKYNCIAYKGLIMTYRSGYLIGFGVALLTILSVATPTNADLSLFVGTVGFDEEANLETAPAFGLRWGKGSSIFGGETSLMIARPPRQIVDSEETATAIFYEGRFLLNIPAGQFKPFVGVGFGAVTVTSTDLPTGIPQDTQAALSSATDLQTSTSISYGGGLRYGLSERLDVRLDLRQYLVFSVTGIVKSAAVQELQEQTGQNVPKSDDSTVQYNELSAGVSFNF